MQTAHIANYTKFQKKMAPARRRDTFDCEILEDPLKKLAVHSTKYNPHKNMEIKGLFKGKEENDRSISKKSKIVNNNHPFLRFIGKKNHKDKTESPYSKPLHYRNTSLQSNNGYSVSTQK